MKIFAPIYYNNFRCIAEKCKNNCCIGWEIDIDENSLEFYKTKPELRNKIDFTGTPHFILDKNERCPFLSNHNLCEIINNYGEERLCQICSDHPRFRSFFDTRGEIGLGLTCEAAVKLILDNDFSLIEIGEDSEEESENREERVFFKERENIFKSDLFPLTSLLPDITLNSLYEFLSGLERLNTKWDKCLEKLKGNTKHIRETKIGDIKKAKRLFDYFVFRYYHEYSLTFCLTCTYIITAIGGDFYDTARMFSSEIEYSDENLEKLCEFCN